MLETTRTKQVHILSAALRTFGRYGYRRTSMEAIAQAAQVSRPALYQHFRNKKDVFRAMTGQLLDTAIEAAEAALRSDRDARERLFDILSLKVEFVSGTVDAQFRSELLADAQEIAGDLLEAHDRRTISVIGALLSSAEELDLDGAEFPVEATAALLRDAVIGISQENAPADVLTERLHHLVELTFRGLARP